MKKALLIAAAVLFVASAASAQPPVGYMGLFKDLTHNLDPAANTITSPCPLAENYAFNSWLWILPSVRGAQAVQYKVVLPQYMILLSKTKNTFVGDVVLGSDLDGISVTFTSCVMDWAYVYRYRFMTQGDPDTGDYTPISQQKIDLVPDPLVQPPMLIMATCELNNPAEMCRYLTPLYLCWTPPPGPVGVQETSWGAIKSLF